ncbi:hypothetical protein ACFL56_03495 [Candidatus Margulisiibacteriota bacterium]
MRKIIEFHEQQPIQKLSNIKSINNFLIKLAITKTITNLHLDTNGMPALINLSIPKDFATIDFPYMNISLVYKKSLLDLDIARYVSEQVLTHNVYFEYVSKKLSVAYHDYNDLIREHSIPDYPIGHIIKKILFTLSCLVQFKTVSSYIRQIKTYYATLSYEYFFINRVIVSGLTLIKKYEQTIVNSLDTQLKNNYYDLVFLIERIVDAHNCFQDTYHKHVYFLTQSIESPTISDLLKKWV